MSAEIDAQLSTGTLRRQLLILSIISLFVELLIIRWLATEIRIFAYFKNLPLMTAFLGLGLGFILCRYKKDFFPLSALTLLYLSGLFLLAPFEGFTHMTFVDPKAGTIFLGLWEVGSDVWISQVRSIIVVLVVFALSTFTFVGIGQRLGLLFEKFKPLEAYSINILGSLIGSVGFTLLCMVKTTPGVWLAVAGVLYLAIDRKRVTHYALIVFGLVCVFFLSPYLSEKGMHPRFMETVWSPYYRIDVLKAFDDDKDTGTLIGYNLRVNYDSFQTIIDSSPEALAKTIGSFQQEVRSFYNLPYRFLDPNPHRRVLVMGAGTGNDVAAALRNGAEHVDAVEIDSVLIELGRKYHPEHPYDSDRVTVHVMDARSFLKRTKERYDLIVFATLDSQTAFSALSSLRLDNYIFTVEAFRDAKNLLNKAGVIFVAFVLPKPWLYDRYVNELTEAVGKPPLGYSNDALPYMGYLLAGPDIQSKANVEMPPNFHTRSTTINNAVPVATDDWPFTFLPERVLPLEYLIPMMCIFAIVFLPIGKSFSGGMKDVKNWQMFGLGVGFLLLEVRAMAKLSLLFGSTWIVNSVIISGVLIAIMAANWLAQKIEVKNFKYFAIALMLSLVASTLFDVHVLSSMDISLAAGLGSLVFLLPLVFAAIIFGCLFRDAKDPPAALAFNLVGGVLGIFTEYLSMWLGINALGIVAILIYGLTLFSVILNKNGSEQKSENSTV